jgi:hypothetical protein
MPEIEIVPWRQKQELALQVLPRPSCPHHISRGEGFDEQPLPGLGSEDLWCT